eukprot:1137554-Pelagomonas_calceolata.AAC.7
MDPKAVLLLLRSGWVKGSLASKMLATTFIPDQSCRQGEKKVSRMSAHSVRRTHRHTMTRCRQHQAGRPRVCNGCLDAPEKEG